MPVSIDELCEQLDIREIPPLEAEAAKISHPHYGDAFDGFALPTHRVITPIISQRLSGAESVLEIGFGTGFRLLYYALNNPLTKFTAIDNDPVVFSILERRIRKLGVSNVRLLHTDLFDLTSRNGRYACVIAIDCLPTEVPEHLRKHFRDYTSMAFTSHLLFGQLVDTTQKPSFFASVSYGNWTEDHQVTYLDLGRKIGLNELETIPFDYKRKGQAEEHGTVILASK